jgi:hypothetical protein
MEKHNDNTVLEINNKNVTIWELDAVPGFEQEVFNNYFKYGKLVSIGCLLNKQSKIKFSRNGKEYDIVKLLESKRLNYKLINSDLTTQYFSKNDSIRYIYEDVTSNAFWVNYFDNDGELQPEDFTLRLENLTYSYYQDEIRQTLGYYLITGIKYKKNKNFEPIGLVSTANSYVQIYQQNFVFEDEINMGLIL